MWRDLRYALRSLRGTPTFTLAVILALALAIGANAAIFSLVDGLWFRPPGVRDPGTIVRVFSTTPASSDGTWSFPEYATLRDGSSSFDGVIARGRRGTVKVGADGQSELLLVNVVSVNFFTTLGLAAEQGRLFAPGDEAALERQPGVVLGHAFWEREFGADPNVIGTTVRLGAGARVSATVLGVLPATFRDLEADADRDLWMPPQTWTALTDPTEFARYDDRWFDVIARRRSGVAVAAANAEVVALAATMARANPVTNQGRGGRAISDLDYRLETGGVNALALLALVLLVVLITCVNVANLLIARAASRVREFAMRVALGAGRRQLARQLMTESALLGLSGAAAGVVVAMWLIRILPAILVQPPGFHSPLLFETDGRVLGFTLIVTAVTSVLFGLAPSLLAARTDVVTLVKIEAVSTSPSRGSVRLGSALVVGQVAVSLVLLSAAAVLTRSFLETERADLGFARKPLLAAWATSGALPAAAGVAAVARLEALPTVRHVAVAIRAPLSLSGGGLAQPVVPSSMPEPPASGFPQVKFNAVSANYFETMGTRVIAGRDFSPADEAMGDPVIVVNERFAGRFYPGQAAVGQLVRVGGPAGAPHRIIGVVEDAVINRIGEAPEPYFYLPYWRGTYGEITFLIDASQDAAELSAAVRSSLRQSDPRLEPRAMATLSQYIAYSASAYQATAALAGALGTVGLILTGLGVYGVVASRAARRTKEIGIRIALGAARGQVLGMVVTEGARLGLLGLVIGIPAALVTTRVMRSLLFVVDPWDPSALVAAIAMLCLAIAVATLLPASRAVRTSPATALRES